MLARRPSDYALTRAHQRHVIRNNLERRTGRGSRESNEIELIGGRQSRELRA